MPTLPITVKVNTKKATLRINEALVRGNSYEITWEGADGYSSPRLILKACSNDPLVYASSEGDDAMHLDSDVLFKAFGYDAIDYTMLPTIAYAVADGVVLAMATVHVRYSPIAFTPTGQPALYKGDKGDKGDMGQQGVPGLSAYQVALENGYVGTEAQWLASLSPTMDAHPTDQSANAATSGGIHAMLMWYAGRVPVQGTSMWQRVAYVDIGGQLYLQRIGPAETPPF